MWEWIGVEGVGVVGVGRRFAANDGLRYCVDGVWWRGLGVAALSGTWPPGFFGRD